MPYPSTLGTFTDPLANQKLNNPSHSSIESAQNTGIEEIQAFVGTLSSTQGTLMYDVRAAASNGGGHVQTANKGGTGYTSYTKGDLLVASSASVLSKLAVGADNLVLVANSSVASGINWAVPLTTKISNSASIISIGSIVNVEASIMSVSVPASTLGTSGAVRTTLYVTAMEGNSGSASVLVSAVYGNTKVASVLFLPLQVGSVAGKFEYTLIANAATNAQRGNFFFNLVDGGTKTSILTNPNLPFVTGTSSEDSGSIKPVGFVARFSNSGADDRIEINGYTVEKIV